MRLPTAWLLALLLVAPGLATAQSARIVADDDARVYEAILRLQRRGHLLALNPTVAPYTEGEVARALAAVDTAALRPLERAWWRRVAGALSPDTVAAGPVGRLEVGLGGAATNNERLEPLRWTDAEEANYRLGSANLYPRTWLRASLAYGPWAAQLGAHVDVFYEDDPDGLDVVNKSVFLRNQEGYAGASGRWAAAYLGSTARHWGLATGEGLFLSHNPRTMDGVSLRLGGERLAVRATLAELDAATLDGRFTGRAGEDPRATVRRRYLAARRIDWRPRPWLTVAGVESMLSSGPAAAPTLAMLLPTSVYSFLNDGPPINMSNNGFVGGMLWVQRGPVSVYGQLAMDDFDIFNRAEPTSLALTGTATVAGLAGGAVDAGLDLTVVTARAYNTSDPVMAYLFALRGIGTQFSDYVHLRLGTDLYLEGAVPGLTLRPEVQALWQGEADPREPYLTNEPPTILVGTPERTLRAGLRAEWAPTARWWLRADAGVNVIDNDGWIDGRTATRFVALVEGGGRWRLGGSVR